MANENMRETDLVLSPNEFAFVLDTTKGNVSAAVGPYKTSLSTSDRMVVFNEITKRFDEVDYISDAIQKFITAPENWYVQLKNPAPEGKHPTITTLNLLPELNIGRKINILGPCSFALFPGQMAKVIPGHRMHSNQYLKARVYDADAANNASANLYGEVSDPDSSKSNKNMNEEVTHEDSNDTNITSTPSPEKYVVGQILIIKGTDVPFYIPPTGIEVLPIGGNGNKYVRDALTLRKLEYCILENESGKRSYIHGPAVVFPKPDQSFVHDDEGKVVFDAIELSEISGVYIKVDNDYEENGKQFKAGQELFITGKETPIYFPREEHKIIDYNGKIVYHAIAIPEGEGRYIMNRKTGIVRTVKGPDMYLPNPIDEVVVKRYLTKDQCGLWYPGNRDVLVHNLGHDQYDESDCSNDFSEGTTLESRLTKAISAPKGFSRSTSYTPPRTITLDTKFDGAVSISVRTGYAVNVISKNGQREVVVGPKTILLDYDQTLEVLELSTGKTKTTNHLLREVYLRVENNKVSDTIRVETADFVKADVKVSYSVNFMKEHKDKWFSIENYVKFLCDRERSMLKMIVKQYGIEEFYANSTNIVRSALLGIWTLDNADVEDIDTINVSMVFEENGMEISDVDVLDVILQSDVEDIISRYQSDIINRSFMLTAENKSLALKQELAKIEKEKLELDRQTEIAKIAKEMAIEEETVKLEEIKQQNRINAATKEQDLVAMNVSNQQIKDEYELEFEEHKSKIRQAERQSQTAQITAILKEISPQLVAAMESSMNATIVADIIENISPYALAENSNAVDIMNRIVCGTPLETSLKNIMAKTDN